MLLIEWGNHDKTTRGPEGSFPGSSPDGIEKKSVFLQSKGLRFTEDLTKEDRENRQKLWPMIKKAREEGKTAYSVGGRGFINGSEIHPQI